MLKSNKISNNFSRAGNCIFGVYISSDIFFNYNILIYTGQMFRRQVQEDSDFSVKKYYRRRPIKKRKNKMRSSGSGQDYQQTTGKWNLQETKFYVDFLKDNKDVINDFKCRREMKIFKQMSEYIKTRTPDQCRSHHQKVQKLHKAIEDIITFYDRKVMFGANKKIKMHQNIIIVRGLEKDQKTTQLVESEEYFTSREYNGKLLITIRQDQMTQY